MSAAQARNTHLVRDNAAEYGIGICEQSSIHTAGGHPAACVSDSGGIRNGESLGQFQPLHSPFSWRPGIHKEKFSAATSSLSSSSISRADLLSPESIRKQCENCNRLQDREQRTGLRILEFLELIPTFSVAKSATMKERQSEEQNLHDTTWLSWWCSNAFKSLLLLLLLCGRRTVLRRRLSLHDGSSLSSLAIHSVISTFSLPFIPVSINRSTGRHSPLLLFSASGSHCLLLSLSHTYFSNFSASCPARKKLPKI